MISIAYGKTGSDETCTYYVTTSQMTVGEFIEEWLAEHQKEWGYFGISDGCSIFGNPKCEYSHGEIKGEPIPNDYLCKQIKSVTGSGGWSRSDFLFYVDLQ